MRALKPGGILSVTLWNKEEPPKSVLKLYATMAAAARDVDGARHRRTRFFVASTYLSTATVLYKRGGFTPEEIAKLREHTQARCRSTRSIPRASRYDTSQTCRRSCRTIATSSSPTGAAARSDGAAGGDGAARQAAAGRRRAAPARPTTAADGTPPAPTVPATVMGRLAWHCLIDGGWQKVADDYVFDTRDAHQRPALLRRLHQGAGPAASSLDRLELVQDEWGYLLLVGDARHRLRSSPSRWCCSR